MRHLLLLVILVLAPPPSLARAEALSWQTRTVADWFQVRELRPNLFLVFEPADGGFYVLKSGDEALLVDAGFGLSDRLSDAILKHLGIRKFSLVITHAHCDHVGLASRAEKVYLHRKEWERFKARHGERQIAFYYGLLKNEVPWPKDLKGVPTQKPWKPSNLIDDGAEIALGPWKLQAIHAPGHTAGHMIFREKSAGLLFLGDLLYDGELYLHKHDSSLAEFAKSLDKLEGLVTEAHGRLLLLPAHNSVPLDLGYISRARDVLKSVRNGEIEASGHGDENQEYVAWRKFRSDGVTMKVSASQLK
jgi:glyoxylase-like metal-dependent hydrolase (beta-lactamase superfamily II)